MKFVDECTVKVIAGSGGNGCVAFRREKFVPHGGPSGGDGGRGGDIVFETAPGLSTLIDFTHTKILRAKHGEHGMGSDRYGRGAEDFVVRVPTGTQIFDEDSGSLLFDLAEPNVRTVIAKGGKGGRGNIHFATSFDRAPRRAEPGEPGEEKNLRLELKVMADVGLLGFPNVGKSTFIRAVSRARPKVADYPFTTLEPHLGVVSVTEDASFVLADIPGLIPGAAEGVGLGHRFLKHVERTRALLHLVTLDPGEGREPLADYDVVMNELEKFDPALARRPQIVIMSKADVTEVREAYPAVKAAFKKRKIDLRLVSAATGEGVREVLFDLLAHLSGRAALEEEDEPPTLRLEPEPPTQRLPAKKPAPTKTKAAPLAKAKKKAAPPEKKTADKLLLSKQLKSKAKKGTLRPKKTRAHEKAKPKTAKRRAAKKKK